MRGLKALLIIGGALCFLSAQPALAKTGDFGFFTGISEGRKLPKSTELLLEKNSNSKDEVEAVYKEVMFLTGTPTVFQGKMTTTIGSYDTAKSPGEYTVEYKVESTDSTNDEDNKIERTIKYAVDFRKEGDQVIKDYEIDKAGDWSETMTINGVQYSLDAEQSYSNIGIIELSLIHI